MFLNLIHSCNRVPGATHIMQAAISSIRASMVDESHSHALQASRRSPPLPRYPQHTGFKERKTSNAKIDPLEFGRTGPPRTWTLPRQQNRLRLLQ